MAIFKSSPCPGNCGNFMAHKVGESAPLCNVCKGDRSETLEEVKAERDALAALCGAVAVVLERTANDTLADEVADELRRQAKRTK